MGDAKNEKAVRPPNSPRRNGIEKSVIPIAPAFLMALFPPPDESADFHALTAEETNAKQPAVHPVNQMVIKSAPSFSDAENTTAASVKRVRITPGIM